MPKARSALLSAVSGSLKDSLTFRNNPQTDGITMQTRPVPTGAPTAKQTAIREAYARLAWLWKNLSSLDKEPYEIMAEVRNLTPWNCWLSFHLPLMRLSPKLYVPFSEGTGTTIQDFAIGGLTGTANGPVWQEKNQFPHLSFDGVDDRLVFARTGYYDNLPESTFFLLFHPSSLKTGLQYLMLTKSASAKNSGFFLLYSTALKPILNFGNGTQRTEKIATNTLSMDTLNSLAVIHSGNNLTFYINGKVNTFTPVPVGMAPSGENLGIIGQFSSPYLSKSNMYISSIIPSALPLATVAALDAHYRNHLT